jgi:hypothetical protein
VPAFVRIIRYFTKFGLRRYNIILSAIYSKDDLCKPEILNYVITSRNLPVYQRGYADVSSIKLRSVIIFDYFFDKELISKAFFGPRLTGVFKKNLVYLLYGGVVSSHFDFFCFLNASATVGAKSLMNDMRTSIDFSGYRQFPVISKIFDDEFFDKFIDVFALDYVSSSDTAIDFTCLSSFNASDYYAKFYPLLIDDVYGGLFINVFDSEIH